MAGVGQSSNLGSLKLNKLSIAGIGTTSAIYFADVFLKASHKCFWFDELFAVYLCRLPSFRDTWAAVTHGADFNPPLFYLLTRAAQRAFGEGLVATRLPEIVGVWLFCMCLFLFVARRAGVISGFIAGAFPFFTLAQYYAYEARAHGIVLGWCGLTLVCWQMHEERRANHLWLVGFGLSLTGALLTHVYAIYLLVPFAVIEMYNLFRKSPDWRVIAVMGLIFTSVTLAVYLPLFRAYRSTMTPTFFAASHDVVQRFMVNVIGPATVVFVLWLLLFVSGGARRSTEASTVVAIPQREVLLAIGFTCIPLVGLIGCKISHGPFFDRYFLSAMAGPAILLGFASSRRQAGCWAARMLAGSMLFLMIADLGSTIYLTANERLVLVEPSSGIPIATTPRDPMRLFETVSTSRGGLDILVISELEYIYFFNYAPRSVVPHLYFAAPTGNLYFAAYKRLEKGAGIDLRLTTFDPFLATHNHFLVYERGNARLIDALQAISSRGYLLKSARADAEGIMLEYSK